jgi:acetyl/propionyl-CoA carboxylase alpha subunit
MNHKAFVTGKFDTKFVENYYQPENRKLDKDELRAAAALLVYLKEKDKIKTAGNQNNNAKGWLNRLKDNG